MGIFFESGFVPKLPNCRGTSSLTFDFNNRTSAATVIVSEIFIDRTSHLFVHAPKDSGFTDGHIS